MKKHIHSMKFKTIIASLALIPAAAIAGCEGEKATIPSPDEYIAGEKFEACASGNGPVDAAISAIKVIIRRNMLVKEFLIQAINKGSNDVGKVHLTVEHDGQQYYGFSANTDIIGASAEAFVDAINKFVR